MALVLVVSGCETYRAGALRPPGDAPGYRALGCIDVNVTSRQSPVDARDVELAFSFGNHCRRPILVDFTKLRVTDCKGTELTVFDPRGELRPARLDAETQAREIIEYQPAKAENPPITDACVDVSGFESGVNSQQIPPICVSEPGGAAPCAR